ncbi:MAG: tRNA (guanosine(37)-N1)-methyltransferase TrmD [Bacillota bacterium]
MVFDILTLFPEMFSGPFSSSILKRAQARGLIEINLIDIRDFARNKHRTVDDAPFGGGGGMVLEPGPIFEAVEFVCRQRAPGGPVILLDPQGERFDQRLAQELARESHLVLICGHYEGVDERVREHLVTREISIGDYVLTGGELPAMVVVDAVARLVPGVLGEAGAARDDSFASGLLEYPQYTRPRAYRGLEVPEILLSGHHGVIERWRREEALLRTLVRRPDLLTTRELAVWEREVLREVAGRIEELLAGRRKDMVQ